MNKSLSITPLAITRVDEQSGCVAGLTEQGLWIRPQPVSLNALVKPPYQFCYEKIVTLTLNKKNNDNTRTEDYTLIDIAATNQQKTKFNSVIKQALIERFLDLNVTTAFTKLRSVGIIRATIHDLYYKRATGGRTFLRMKFSDITGKIYDWIVPEINLNHAVKQSSSPNELVDRLSKLPHIYLTIGLTLPNNRFPGKFRGCHPLVVGLHTFPDYTCSI